MFTGTSAKRVPRASSQTVKTVFVHFDGGFRQERSAVVNLYQRFERTKVAGVACAYVVSVPICRKCGSVDAIVCEKTFVFCATAGAYGHRTCCFHRFVEADRGHSVCSFLAF